MSLEGWKSFFEIGGVVLLLLTFVFGVGALFTTRRLNVIQDRELKEFRLKFEEEQQKTARAQKEAADSQFRLQQIAEYVATPRRVVLDSRNNDEAIRRPKFKELQKYKGTTALVMPIPGDNEAKTLTNDIGFVLQQAGWKVKVAELPANIPPWSISNGVQVRTAGKNVRLARGESRSGPPPPPVVTVLLDFLNLDLVAPIGVVWNLETSINGEAFGLARYGFNIQEGEVVITVGAKPTWEYFITHRPTPPPESK